mmetsp:Transcript_21819/g.19879  ORF Transcript_21819/g.19879 Transcript_21819/m.19879 type:complete len:406 (-) Transcript_21819:2148-3365(-)
MKIVVFQVVVLFSVFIHKFVICFHFTKFSLNSNSRILKNNDYKFILTSLNSNPRKIDINDGQNSFAKELVKHNLLTSADEQSLAKQFQLSVQIKAQSKHMTENFKRPVTNEELSAALGITADQVPILIEKGENAKKVLVKANMRLVFHIARYYRNRGVAYPDLVQEGTFGLIKAVDKYDPERGFRFSTYASWWIKQSVSRAIAEKSRIVRLPVHIHDLVTSIARSQKQFFQTYGRKPTNFELADILCLPVQKIDLLQKCARDVTSIDDDAYSNKGKAITNSEPRVKDRISSFQVEPSSVNERDAMRVEIRRAMGVLSEREAQIVEMRFGLTADGTQFTLEEIGKLFNVTRERIRQIEARALSKLRSPSKTDEIKEIFQDHSVVVPASSISAPLIIENRATVSMLN